MVLLQHPDIDLRAKDFEGYSPFDLYNSTVEGPKPSSTEGFPASDNVFDLLTWGANRFAPRLGFSVCITQRNARNAALAHGDAADRSYPDPVAIPAHPNRVSPTDSTSLKVGVFNAVCLFRSNRRRRGSQPYGSSKLSCQNSILWSSRMRPMNSTFESVDSVPAVG